jgi:hypothetical protein
VVVDFNVFCTYAEEARVEEPRVSIYTAAVRGIGGVNRTGRAKRRRRGRGRREQRERRGSARRGDRRNRRENDRRDR